MHECGGRPELNCFNFGLKICAHWNKKMRFTGGGVGFRRSEALACCLLCFASSSM